MAIDPTELPAAVRDGRVDAQENPLTNLVNFGIHRHHPYITLSAHLFGVAPVLEATAAQRAFAREDDVTCLAKLGEAGNQVLELSAAERSAFAAAIAPVVDAERARLDPVALELLRTAG